MEDSPGYYRKTFLRTVFPEQQYSSKDFGERARKALSSLLEITVPAAQDESLQRLIEGCLQNIQTKTLPDVIEDSLQRELDSEKDMYLRYIDPAILERLKTLNPTRVTRNRLSRIPGKIMRIPPSLANLQELEQTRRRGIRLSSYFLTRLCRNVRLRRQFVSVNSVVLPHLQSRKRLELESDPPESELVNQGSVIITVSFYHQVRGMKIAEFDILDFQTLLDLKNAFKCHDAEQEQELLGFEPSGSCFEINGDLYVDGGAGGESYARTLHGFTSKPYPEVLEMAKTTLSQIQLPINTRSAYLHSGDCEHRVTFTNMRLFDSKYDCPFSKAYPVLTYSHSKTLTFCEICGVNQASKVIFNSVNLPRNPSQLCDSCTFTFLYDKDTKLPVEKCIIKSINNEAFATDSNTPNSN
ncbi:snRNA-activating protein of 50kDa MW C terminal [Cryptosporidium felis]|nr:snRNA-activating protein of 50kDa MW C terminal [Cryptosporidium felis]